MLMSILYDIVSDMLNETRPPGWVHYITELENERDEGLEPDVGHQHAEVGRLCIQKLTVWCNGQFNQTPVYNQTV